jgi:signal transduction histidine kinase/ActR/RegA family two-component response regulator
MPPSAEPRPVGGAETDSSDDLTARSALRSLVVASVFVVVPAVLRPESARYYAAQGAALLAGALVLAALRHRLGPKMVARATLGLAAIVVSVSAWVSGGVGSGVYHSYAVALTAAAWIVFEPPAAVAATATIIAVGGGFVVATARQWIPTPWVVHAPVHLWVTTSTAVALVALVQWLEVHRLRASQSALRSLLLRSERAQRQALESEQRYAEVVSTAPGAVYQFEVRPDGTRAFPFVSEGARQLFDCAPAAIVADPALLFSMVESGADRERLESSIAHSYAALTPWEYEGVIRSPADRVRCIRGQSVPARLADGTVRWHGFLTDVTERIKIEQALRDSQAALKHSLSLMQSAFESTADGLLTVDLGGRVTAYNQKFLALWRVPIAIAATRDDRQLLHHVVGQMADADAFLAGVKDLYARRDAVLFDTLEFKDGRRYERYSQPQVVDGVVVGRVWSFRDVTARVDDERRRAELEQQLQRAQTLETLGALAGGIAHDFNNLLTIVLGNVEEASAEADPERRQASLDAIAHAAHRAGALVREIREFSQPRAIERRVVAVADAVRSVLQLLRATMPKHLAIETMLDPDITMFANGTQFQQVVTNLVINAAQAIGDVAGRIVVSVDGVAADDVPASTPMPRAAHYARLTVTDTGRGIDAGALPHIFDPFYSTKPGVGSGLGLAVVHGIVKRHHGTIVVDTALHRGTTFQVYCPALPPATTPQVVDAAPLRVTAPAPLGQHRRILVVDDEPEIAKVIADGLRRIGYEVTALHDPREALSHFLAAPSAIDAVLSDLSMPHLSGLDLGRRMLDTRPDMPIVLFTGYAADLSPEQAQAAGFRAVLNKPMSLAVLAEALHRALGSSPAR